VLLSRFFLDKIDCMHLKIGIYMILDKKTFEIFKYEPKDLSEKSSKPIFVQCDYCGIEYESTPKRVYIANILIKKDSCQKCKYIKMAEMNKIRYGVENVFMLNSTKKKIKETCVNKYGVTHHLQNEEILNKRRRTNKEKYGHEEVMQSEEIKNKYRSTCLDKYGVENPSSLESVKAKRRLTNLDKFGKESYLQSDACKEATIRSLGVDNPFKLEIYQQKARDTIREKYGVDHHMMVKEICDQAHAKCIQTKINKGQIKQYDNKGVREWSEITGFSRSTFNALVNEYGWEQAIRMTPRMSSLELSMQKILDSIGEEYNKQVKIDNYYADFLIKDVIIECDGLYWHSEHNKTNDYHSVKREVYDKLGYKPLFFREDEIRNKPSIVKSIIQNKLLLSNKVFARKCDLINISKYVGDNFLDNNHLMGRGSGKCYALYFSGDIVAALRMKKIKGGWEVSRFATKNGINVVGGFSKLISNFQKENSGAITTFIDMRYGSGSYLSSLGFVYSNCYLSFKWTDGFETFHRMKYRSNTGYDSGLYKIWDCGQAKYIKPF
jgi:very-short-patch-repair endonuclease